LVAVPEIGHLNPISMIAQCLQNRGHRAVVITSNYGSEKAVSFLKEKGIKEIVVTADSIARETMTDQIHKWNDIYDRGLGAWTEYVKKELQVLDPDIVVSDWMSVSGHKAADSLGKVCIVNVPGSLQFANMVTTLPTAQNSSSLFGCMVVRQPFFQFAMGLGLNKIFDHPEFRRLVLSMARRPCLVNSFWGDSATSLCPPNCFMIGPLLNLDSE
jgi:rhodanese-related sulfurtransferase